MPQEIHLWKVEDGDVLRAVSPTALNLEARLEQWLVEDISVLGLELLVIGEQVQTSWGGALDLLCMDPQGDLVVIELKRNRTPREVAAQLLDYGGWVEELGSDQVLSIAENHFGDPDALSAAFKETFGEELPDVVNESHRLLAVASELDGKSERIIRYLSDVYGVNVNAATFQVFETDNGDEFLGRVFLVEPEEVDRRSRDKSKSKRRRRPTIEELKRRAADAGVGELFENLVDEFSAVFGTKSRRADSIAFRQPWERRDAGYSVMMNLYPDHSEARDGVFYTFYTQRAADVFDVGAEDLIGALPEGSSNWKFKTADEQSDQWEWDGHEGVFRSLDEGIQLVRELQR